MVDACTAYACTRRRLTCRQVHRRAAVAHTERRRGEFRVVLERLAIGTVCSTLTNRDTSDVVASPRVRLRCRQPASGRWQAQKVWFHGSTPALPLKSFLAAAA